MAKKVLLADNVFSRDECDFAAFAIAAAAPGAFKVDMMRPLGQPVGAKGAGE